MGVKVYVSGISGNKEVKKRQQRVFMILESKHIPYDVVDITEPGKENEKDFMQNNSTSSGATVSDTNPRHPLPPQLFNDDEYCGDYDQFDLANEIDNLEQFLKVPIKNSNSVEDQPKKIPETPAVNNVNDVIETNGISSSREASVESEIKSNGGGEQQQVQEQQQDEVEEDAVVEEANETDNLTEDTKRDLDPSEAFIQNEQAASE